MITEKDIARINELYHKSKGEGLTDAEKAEQAKLRRAYIDAIKGNVRAQLNNIDIVDENGDIYFASNHPQTFDALGTVKIYFVTKTERLKDNEI